MKEAILFDSYFSSRKFIQLPLAQVEHVPIFQRVQFSFTPQRTPAETHSIPFVRKDQLEITWRLLKSQSAPGHCQFSSLRTWRESRVSDFTR